MVRTTYGGYRPLKLGAQISLGADDHRKLLWGPNGDWVWWQIAQRCPCRVTLAQGGRATSLREGREGCPGCHGSGYLYHPGARVRVIGSDASAIASMQRLYGEFVEGMAKITFLPEHMPGKWDRITFLDSAIRYDEVRQRTGDIDELTYPIVTRTIPTGDDDDPTTLIPRDVDVVAIWRADESGELVGDPLVPDVDFTATTKIAWTTGGVGGVGAPAVGEWYSVMYYANPRYVVHHVTRAHRDAWVGKQKTDRGYMPLEADCYLEHYGPPHAGAAEEVGEGGP